MTPQDFKALLDILMDINSNLEKIAKLESVLLPLKALIESQATVVSGEPYKLSLGATGDPADIKKEGGEQK